MQRKTIEIYINRLSVTFSISHLVRASLCNGEKVVHNGFHPKLESAVYMIDPFALELTQGETIQAEALCMPRMLNNRKDDYEDQLSQKEGIFGRKKKFENKETKPIVKTQAARSAARGSMANNAGFAHSAMDIDHLHTVAHMLDASICRHLDLELGVAPMDLLAYSHIPICTHLPAHPGGHKSLL